MGLRGTGGDRRKLAIKEEKAFGLRTEGRRENGRVKRQKKPKPWRDSLLLRRGGKTSGEGKGREGASRSQNQRRDWPPNLYFGKGLYPMYVRRKNQREGEIHGQEGRATRKLDEESDKIRPIEGSV